MGGIQDKIICLDLEKVKEIQLLETGILKLGILNFFAADVRYRYLFPFKIKSLVLPCLILNSKVYAGRNKNFVINFS
jgi:hypothetical protein